MEKVKRKDMSKLFFEETELTRYALRFVEKSDDENSEVVLVKHQKNCSNEKAIIVFEEIIYIFVWTIHSKNVSVEMLNKYDIEEIWEAVKNQ